MEGGYHGMKLDQSSLWTFVSTFACLAIGQGSGCRGPHSPSPRTNEIALSRWEAMTAATGATLAPKELTTATGDTTTIRFDAGAPSAILLLSGNDCYSCGNIQQDAWELHRWATRHRGRLLIVLSTDSLGLARSFARGLRLPVPVLVDSAQRLLSAFGGEAHPLAAIAGPHGVVVTVLNRSPRYANYRPLRALLEETEAAFTPVVSSGMAPP